MADKHAERAHSDLVAKQISRLLELEAQVRRFATRVEQLWRQRAGLVALLRSIKKHGGVTDRDWRSIDRILASGRWTDEDDSGKH